MTFYEIFQRKSDGKFEIYISKNSFYYQLSLHTRYDSVTFDYISDCIIRFINNVLARRSNPCEIDLTQYKSVCRFIDKEDLYKNYQELVL